MKEILRKCHLCDDTGYKTINVDKDKFVYYKTHFYHYDCFIEFKNKNNKDNLSQDQIIKIVDEMVLKTQELKSVRESIDRDRLTYWLYNNYNISVLPNLFFQKLLRINKGTFSDRISVPISCYDLLQIFKKMKTYLDKVNNNNERKGKKVDLSQRVNYDLSIVLNNYDEYIKWKQKQKTENTENKKLQEEIRTKNNIQTNNIINIQKHVNKQNDNEELNINDLLDEVF